ncbi:hypothetical protein EUTSA_v10025552mg [Eutrema salsugineum]|uniref:Hyaluronan/mRNA-binding protein domain-containing protein n=1 Tax=Eutrema salsugineum TaxID=72664 RepID=V4MRD5_EUTSA|nr:hypothetical protein EUTSA_v10025552mg [Eutrema salsugineum]
MATLNPFDLLGNDAEDPSQLAVSIAPPEKTDKSKKSGPISAAGKLPSKPLPPAQAVKEARSEAPRGGGRGSGGFSRGRGGPGGYNRDFGRGDGPGGNNGYSGGYSKPSEEGDVSKSSYERRGGGGGAPRGSFRGGRREDGEGERPRRTHERRSGTGRGGDFKREGSGRGNWGTPGEEVFAGETEEVAGAETEKNAVEKPAGDDVAADANKENTAEAEEEKEPENKEMTLDEYEKILEEKKKALQSQTTSERKVDTKVFESMQQLSNKKSNDEIFIKVLTRTNAKMTKKRRPKRL